MNVFVTKAMIRTQLIPDRDDIAAPEEDHGPGVALHGLARLHEPELASLHLCSRKSRICSHFLLLNYFGGILTNFTELYIVKMTSC